MTEYRPARAPMNEPARNAFVNKTGVMDSRNLDRYETYVRSAKAITNCPVAYTGLLDENRQYFLARDFDQRFDAEEVARPQTLCQYALLSPEPLIVSDLRQHPQLSKNPLVTEYPNWVFWGAFPIVSPDGLVLGTLCTVDYEPRELSAEQITSMKALADNLSLFILLQMEERVAGTERILNAVRTVSAKCPNVSLSSFADFLTLCNGAALDASTGSELVRLGLAQGDKQLSLTAFGRQIQNENGLVASGFRRASIPSRKAMSIDAIFEMME